MPKAFSAPRALAGLLLSAGLIGAASSCAPMARAPATMTEPAKAQPQEQPAGEANAPASAPAPQPETRPLRAGEAVRVYVDGEEALSRLYVIEPGGFITMPWIGAVMLQDLSPTTAQQKIRAMLEDGYLREAFVTLERVDMRPLYMIEGTGASPAGGALLLEMQGRPE